MTSEVISDCLRFILSNAAKVRQISVVKGNDVHDILEVDVATLTI